jgi:hypothetical protein
MSDNREVSISDEAVEAAAEALVGSTLGDRAGINWEEFFEASRKALAAAAPHMQSSGISATEIEAVAHMLKAAKAEGWDEGQKSGMRHADRLRAAAILERPELPGPLSPNPYRKEAK